MFSRSVVSSKPSIYRRVTFREMQSVLETDSGKEHDNGNRLQAPKNNISWFFRAEYQELQTALKHGITVTTRQYNIRCLWAAMQEFGNKCGFPNAVNF